MINDVFEIIHTTRAMRRLKSDPVPDDLVVQILEAAVCAPSGGNNQNWGFIVCTDTEIKQQVQRYYKKAFDEYVLPHYDSQRETPPPGMSKRQFALQIERVTHLTDHFHEAPVWIVACLDSGERPPNRLSGASIYPAVQNMLLAARALGLGATLTTRHAIYGAEVDQLFRLPDNVHSYAIVPIGYPAGRFGRVRRGALADIVHRDRWGESYTAAQADESS